MESPRSRIPPQDVLPFLAILNFATGGLETLLSLAGMLAPIREMFVCFGALLVLWLPPILTAPVSALETGSVINKF